MASRGDLDTGIHSLLGQAENSNHKINYLKGGKGMMQKSKKRTFAFLMATILAITTFFGDVSAIQSVYAAGGDAQVLDQKFMPEASSREGESTAAQEMTIAEWKNIGTEDTIPSTAVKDGVDVGTLEITSNLTATASSSKNGFNSTGWYNSMPDMEGPNGRGAWIFTFSAAGYGGLKFSASQRSSGTGPGKFRLQYSLEGSNDIIDIQGSEITITSTSSSVTYNSFVLPEELNGQKFKLYVRNYDDTSQGGATIGNGGTSSIKDITLTGTISGSQIVSPEEGMEVETIAAVKAKADATEKSMIEGRVILKEGRKFYLQDSTGGMVVSFKNALANPNPEVGDVLKATGIYGKEMGLHTLKEAVLNGLDKSEEALVSAIKTIAEILADADDALQSTRVRIESVTLGATDESGYTTVTQGNDSIKVYNFPTLANIEENDIVTIDAVVSKNEDQIQLRVASASDVTLVKHVETCAAVTASVKPGFVEPRTEVVLSCALDGATIHYSTDGSNYQVYSEPIVLTEDVTISAYATKEGYIDGPVTSFVYAVENEFTQPDWDQSLSVKIAQWAGNANYEEAQIGTGSIPGDLFATNDMMDADAQYSAVVKGANIQPYMKATSSNTGSTSYYMGGEKLGSGSDDYIQLALSSAGYTNMKLSFRMRGTNAAAGSFQLKYSTDGHNFKDFTTGTYAYKYTAYGSGGASHEEEGSGDITDGVARTSLAPGNYVTFGFDVPMRATDAEHLYIRMVAGNDRADGGTAAITGGTTRVDSVVITGNPIKGNSVCEPVTAAPASGEVLINAPLTLTTKTEGAEIYYSLNNGAFQKYDAQNEPVLADLPVNVRAYASKTGMADSVKLLYQYTQAQASTVRATPNGGAVPAGTIVKLNCNTEGATIYAAKQNADQTWGEWTKVSNNELELSELPAVYKVKATKEGYLESSEVTISYTLRENEKYNIYFGQMHSHTSYSDGAGTAQEAYEHGKAVDNLDFLSVTDHSNSFDNAESASILDGSVSEEWKEGRQLADTYSSEDFVGLFGYEMTWSNGLGHMNTFNSNGFQSRTQTEFATYSTALQNYYAALKTQPDSISQFNHPGTTFGDFSDFAHYDETIDGLITLIEVGNGEGAIGSSGYFPSYEYYQRALDKGWHVAPTNNQDNHKGRWGDANTARSVVLADSLTRGNIYDAMRNNRVYATEDNDLSIYYTLDGYEMGTVLGDGDTGETVHLKAELSDPTDAGLGTVSVITNGGLVLDKKTVTGNKATVEFEIDNKYSYYYLKVVEADGDIAVTAPVWVGSVDEAGINGLTSSAKIPLKGKPLDINLELYNNEKVDLEIRSINFKSGDKVIHAVDLEAGEKIAAGNTKTYSFSYTHDKAGGVQITAEVHAVLNGVDKIYGSTLNLFFMLPELVTKVIIDGTHSNDYVTGNYSGNMGNFTKIAESLNSNKNIEVHIEENQITSELLSDCALLVITAPAKKADGTYQISHFDDAFVQVVKDYADKGGSLIVCGASDFQDTTDVQTSKEINKILAAVGATTRMNSDQAYDETNNGGQPYRLNLKNFNASSKYLKGAVADFVDEEDNKIEGQVYSAYNGCTVALDAEAVAAKKAEALVTGFETTKSIDCKDENGNSVPGTPNFVEPGNVVSLAHETLSSGADIFVAGTVFMSDFEVKAEEDTVKPFLNKTILENILRDSQVALPVTDIADMRKGQMGEIFTIEGYVTAGTATKGNIFFDTIYLQDETAGVTVFPYAHQGLEVGTKVQATGYVDAYQGDKELQLMFTKILDAQPHIYEPQAMTAKEAMNYETSGGKLVKVEGKVVDLLHDASLEGVSQFWLDDGSGEIANIFIDGYILSAETQKNELSSVVKMGSSVSAVGLVYAHPEGESDVPITCLRVRNCDEIRQTVPPVEATGITLDKTTGTIEVGETLELTATVEPAEAEDTVEWISSNNAIATVSHGKVTGVSAGIVEITAQAGSQSVTCTVTVKAKDTEEPPVEVTGITLDKTSGSIEVGETLKLTAKVEPEAAQAEVKWSSSDETIATVNDGVVTGVKAGTAEITATAGEKSATCTVTVKAKDTEEPPVEVTGITLDKTSGSIKVGETLKLTAKVEPEATQAEVKWSSSDETIATVNDGVVTGVKAGTAEITATAGEKSAVCTVTVTEKGTVEPPVEATQVTLDKTSASIGVGETLKLIATVKPEAAASALKWSSSDETVATVNDGVVTGVKAGTAIITATVGDKSAECNITVTDAPSVTVPVTKVTLNKTSATVAKGKTLKLTAKVLPANATNKNVTWKSSNPSIATVTKTGTVKGIKAGTVTITATAGDKKATCKVKVGTVTLNYKSLTMKKGTSTKGLTAKYNNDAYKSWKSSNAKVVKVIVKKGKVTLKALKKGSATIKVTTKSGATASCKVKVQTKDVKTKKLALNKKNATIKVKKSLTLKLTRTPITASDKVTWQSSNKKVATVNKSGKVTAKKAGKATITVKANGKKATCKITVKK